MFMMLKDAIQRDALHEIMFRTGSSGTSVGSKLNKSTQIRKGKLQQHRATGC